MDELTSKRTIKCTVHGDRHLHAVIDGQMITLCGRVAEYPHKWMPERDLCGSCAAVARRDHLALP